MVTDAVKVHNANPHITTGETPFALLFGQDMILPGWQELTSVIKEEERTFKMTNRRMRDLILAQAKRGDIVSYQLADYERKQNPHISVERKYCLKWSLPHRVTEVKDKTLIITPLWNKGKHGQVPLTQVKKLASRVLEALRRITQYTITSMDHPRKMSMSRRTSRDDGVNPAQQMCNETRRSLQGG
eukprot:GHVN01039639.1.p1 GENE.GHVN01039639.1~~GHVN01039639.1.p1  ORF type:complete len:186 (-),score=7.12 GHVN01039639.1:110-667(-)